MKHRIMASIAIGLVAAATPVGNDGALTPTFTSPTTATVDLPGGRNFQIQRLFQ